MVKKVIKWLIKGDRSYKDDRMANGVIGEENGHKGDRKGVIRRIGCIKD